MALVKDILGWLPISVWNLNKHESDKWRIVRDTAGAEFGTHRHTRLYKKFSMFNPALAARVYLYWSKEGDVVVDPFAGRSTRGVVAVLLGRSYFGYDVVSKVVKHSRDNIELACREWKPDEWSHHPGGYTMYEGDGCQMLLTPNDYADLVFTCPPYHQLERYEPALGQLSEIPDYNIFLHSLEACAHNCSRILKPGGFCVFVIADWRYDGKFRCFHLDMYDLLLRAGLLPWDIVINQLNTPAVLGVGIAAEHWKTVKAHEYILVFRKPGGANRTRDTALEQIGNAKNER